MSSNRTLMNWNAGLHEDILIAYQETMKPNPAQLAAIVAPLHEVGYSFRLYHGMFTRILVDEAGLRAHIINQHPVTQVQVEGQQQQPAIRYACSSLVCTNTSRRSGAPSVMSDGTAS
ncbi:Uu.00g111220.m01.CDS01 [Anthostomella pinea]|uniref:Uu.00g111220.m01.CDS01 n=1 Tax=Anthostomella pinea TaxID=933095 RepID=A0AAI8VG41_9PEZI|nr:Uu.00g111220.m01.CDS01 [Anthostomella pinea]